MQWYLSIRLIRFRFNQVVNLVDTILQNLSTVVQKYIWIKLNMNWDWFLNYRLTDDTVVSLPLTLWLHFLIDCKLAVRRRVQGQLWKFPTKNQINRTECTYSISWKFLHLTYYIFCLCLLYLKWDWLKSTPGEELKFIVTHKSLNLPVRFFQLGKSIFQFFLVHFRFSPF